MYNINTAKMYQKWSCQQQQQFSSLSSWWTGLPCCQCFHSVYWIQLVWVIACGCLIKAVTEVWRHKRRWQYEMLRGCPVLTAVMCYFTMPNVPLSREDAQTCLQNTHTTSDIISFNQPDCTWIHTASHTLHLNITFVTECRHLSQFYSQWDIHAAERFLE